MRRRRQDASHESSHGIDLAPMLDFVTNLLIFFIITAVFIKESGLVVNRPTNIVAPDKSESKTIQIQVLQNGEVWVNNRSVDVRAVRANVERMNALNPGSNVLIMADSIAPSGVVVEVVDQVHLGGIYNITFTTTEN